MANPLPKLPLVTLDRDYDSKKSRAQLINLFAEQNKDGSFRSVRRCEGLTEFVNLQVSPIRSNFLINGNLLYVVAGTDFFSITTTGTFNNIGTVGGGANRAVLRQNARPDGNQILILNGEGAGFIYTVGATLEQITDEDFLGARKADILNERFIFPRENSTEFFLSDLSDGTSYDPQSTAFAEQSPDELVNVVAKKSAAWWMGQRTIEYWQTFSSDTVLPLRATQGTAIERGVLAPDSVAKLDDFIAWLADDGTVRMIAGTQMQKISDLDLELRIRGNGTLTLPGFTTIDDAIGWWVDGPIHKIYYLTFPTEGYTWGYDLTTGQSHTRESGGGAWAGVESVIFNNRVLVGAIGSGKIFELDPDNRTEDGEIMRTSLTTPSMSRQQNFTVPLLELDMEVGEIRDPNLNPSLIVQYTKDGTTFQNWGRISLGPQGDYRARVPMRHFGQIIRNKDFAVRFITTDPVEVRYYGLYGDLRQSKL